MDLLTTDEAAAYLRLSERKLYELVANQEIPCTKITGRWLFPRAALDRWLASGMTAVAQGAPRAVPPPPIVIGSHDPLLEWALRQSGCGLANSDAGHDAGLESLAAGQSIAAAIHLHALDGKDEQANPDRVSQFEELHDAVVIAFARRHQGLIVAPGNPLGLTDLASVAASQARLAQHPLDGGGQFLTVALLKRADLVHKVNFANRPLANGAELAKAIRENRIDCGIAPLSVARAERVDFVPLMWERFDLVFRMRDYFRSGPQTLIRFMASELFRDRARELGGYDVSVAGEVRLEPK